jgi:hypothetical protein
MTSMSRIRRAIVDRVLRSGLYARERGSGVPRMVPRRMNPPRNTSSLALLFLVASGCGQKVPGDPGRGAADPHRGGTPITPPTPDQSGLADLQNRLAHVPQTADALLSAHALSYLDQLPYDPGMALGLDKIQASALALDAPELADLAARGFAMSKRERFLTFLHGYSAIYSEHLPLYISADSILYALHRSYDSILAMIESQKLLGEMRQLLNGARDQLARGPVSGLSAEAHQDVDLFLAVAASLIDGKVMAPVAGGDAAAVAKLLALAMAANGAQKVTLFGTIREYDFSQNTPRGHYTWTPELTRYFRAMMWLGRTELRVIETLPDGSPLFHRRQFEGAVLLRALVDTAGQGRWKTIDRVVRAFVGEPDDLTLTDIDRLTADLGAATPAALVAHSDQAIADKIVEKGYGAQRIASQILINGTDKDTLPLGRSFLFFGQRYVLDSHVFSNVVYDRVQKAKVKRMMPDPLDAAFAALGNDAALALLAPGLRKHDYASALASTRVLADAHGADFWGANLYNRWLSALRALSPGRDLRAPAMAGLPSVSRTEPWARRILNTQMASWAELRHDTLLYTKQSYTGTPVCEFPDAYVDPYPAFWRELAALGKEGVALVSGLGLDDLSQARARGFFTELESVAAILADMAERQRTGQPFTREQLVFVNQTVSVVPFVCGSEKAEGWYVRLFATEEDALKFDPTIADVHTQPADEAGNPVGKVLHVGTGHPRLMVITAETCSGPRAYLGLASSYYEVVTKDFERLTDPIWAGKLGRGEVSDVPWVADLVTH